MNALFDRFHNFILPLMRGEDGVCACTCGRHHVYHVVAYDGVMNTRENCTESEILTWQGIHLIAGLLLGLCISLLLLWLDRTRRSQLKYSRANQTNDVDLFSQFTPKHMGDASENMLHTSQDLCPNVNNA